MKKEKIFIFICLVLLSACSSSSLDGIVIEKAADGYKLSIDGRETYIKGVGGTYRLDIAAQSGANAFRTWGGNVEEIKKNLALASEHNMYVMQGIGIGTTLGGNVQPICAAYAFNIGFSSVNGKFITVCRFLYYNTV